MRASRLRHRADLPRLLRSTRRCNRIASDSKGNPLGLPARPTVPVVAPLGAAMGIVGTLVVMASWVVDRRRPDRVAQVGEATPPPDGSD